MPPKQRTNTQYKYTQHYSTTSGRTKNRQLVQTHAALSNGECLQKKKSSYGSTRRPLQDGTTPISREVGWRCDIYRVSHPLVVSNKTSAQCVSGRQTINKKQHEHTRPFLLVGYPHCFCEIILREFYWWSTLLLRLKFVAFFLGYIHTVRKSTTLRINNPKLDRCTDSPKGGHSSAEHEKKNEKKNEKTNKVYSKCRFKEGRNVPILTLNSQESK